MLWHAISASACPRPQAPLPPPERFALLLQYYQRKLFKECVTDDPGPLLTQQAAFHPGQASITVPQYLYGYDGTVLLCSTFIAHGEGLTFSYPDRWTLLNEFSHHMICYKQAIYVKLAVGINTHFHSD